jgi:hypothetical protein
VLDVPLAAPCALEALPSLQQVPRVMSGPAAYQGCDLESLTALLPRLPMLTACAADSCIARFDHHCAWINNCVGLLNLRQFLLFLVANMVLCSYGASDTQSII